MFYLLNFNMLDEKKHPNLVGPLYDRNKERVGYIFYDGIRQDDDKSPYVLVLNKNAIYKKRQLLDKILFFPTGVGDQLFVSPKVVSLLQKLGIDNVQFFDVIVKGDDFLLDNYKLIKILGKIDCIDYEKSDIKFDDEGVIDWVNALCIDEGKIPLGKDILTLDKFFDTRILVSERFKDAVEQEGLTGFSFHNIEDYVNIY